MKLVIDILLNNILGFIRLTAILGSNLIFSQNFSTDNFIYWSKIDTLRIEDFMSKNINDDNMYASTSIILDYYYADSTKSILTVTPVFNKRKSYFTKIVDSQNLLKHEQGHFDILEIFARKIRKKLIEHYSSFNDFINKNDFIKIYKIHVADYKKFAHEYDVDTNHSANKIKQKEWDQKIENELYKLRDYSNSNYLLHYKNTD